MSKKAAMLDLLENVQPDYVNINETQLGGENKVHIKGYNCFLKNRKGMAGGGICSAVVNHPLLKRSSTGLNMTGLRK